MRKPFQRITASYTHLVCNPSVSRETCLKLELQYDKILTVQWKKEFDGGEIPNDSVKFWVAVKQYENAAGVKCFSELAQMVLNAHAIPLSNAFVERIFSHVTNIKSKVRNRLSLETMEAVLRIRSKLAGEKICCNKFKVTDKMLSLFNNSMYSARSIPEAPSTEPSTSRARFVSSATNPSDQESDDLEEILQVEF
ncbi:hypothetical protein Pcinc_010410 [Petrolisthes cinctipes]|nr:hypothetical protein Pcinc_010409 [Petrolisthes cinctipes]KAK3885378.1 hypothetical protein Pcinc_010410 [Petrolisthes cinctipes]